MNKSDEKILLYQFGQALCSCRKKRGISLEKLAYEVGLSKGNLSDIENGKKNPTFITLIKISQGLDIRLSDLFNELQVD